MAETASNRPASRTNLQRGKRAKSPLPRSAAGSASRKRLRPPRLLTYVDAVARHGSIRKAADALNVASSALNRQILDLELDLGSALFERLPRGVIADQVDLVLTHYPPPKKHVAIVATIPQALCALMVRDHPLAGRDDLRLRDCLAYPLALGDSTLAGRALIEQVLAQASFDLDPRLVSNSVETMKAFAHMNRGVCFQFRKPGKALIPPGDMIALPLIDPPLLQARLILATRRGRVLPIAAATFVELLQTALA